jgi:hypothetical protein
MAGAFDIIHFMRRSISMAARMMCFVLLLVAVSPAEARRRNVEQRVGPPAALRCSRDHLTAFIGRVLLYRRQANRLVLRVRTDEETTENFTLRFGKNEDGSRYFLLRGAAFKAEDWKVIERRAGLLKPGMRAIVWVCDDGSTPVVDWRPAEE